jgi:hypothetical protein
MTWRDFWPEDGEEGDGEAERYEDAQNGEQQRPLGEPRRVYVVAFSVRSLGFHWNETQKKGLGKRVQLHFDDALLLTYFICLKTFLINTSETKFYGYPNKPDATN